MDFPSKAFELLIFFLRYNTGYVDGQNYYYSKIDPTVLNGTLTDFMTSDSDCYYAYEGPDLYNYSTSFYRDAAIKTIYEHDQSDPMFMYLAFQAVHVPCEESDGSELDLSVEISSEMYDKILDNVVGTSRQLYAMTLNALDNAVLKIKEALTDAGMISNTYIIFASDNGGCYLGGGKSGPLRGTKYTLLEGGTKVDAFIYSYMLDESLRGTTFDNLFHVSDWFPTILELADITYTPEAGYSLDGVSQVSSWSTGDVVRTTMLYNTYTNIEQYYTDMWQNGTFAVRNEQYKLIHFFNGSYAQWHEYYVEQDDDDNLNTVSSDCTFKGSYKDGNFTYALYDLTNDPYETNNLYDMDDDLDIVAAKTELYALIDRYNTLAKIDSYETATPCSMTCYPVFFSADDYIVPWISGEMTLGDFNTSKSYPSYCGIWNDTAITPTTVWG
jgi:arylsulfatase A-like enzyme